MAGVSSYVTPNSHSKMQCNCLHTFKIQDRKKLCSFLASGTAMGKEETQLNIDPFCKIVLMLQEVIRHTSFQGDPRLIGLVY